MNWTGLSFVAVFLLAGCAAPKKSRTMPPPVPSVAPSFPSVIFLPLTNDDTRIRFSPGWCNDTAWVYAWWDTHGDTNPVYGIRVQALSEAGQVEYVGWVMECYTPPMSETVPVLLTKSTRTVRCTMFGPNLSGKWNNAYFAVPDVRPLLTVKKHGPNLVLSWFDPGRCWQLESNSGDGWEDSNPVVPATKCAEMFRLRRTYPSVVFVDTYPAAGVRQQ